MFYSARQGPRNLTEFSILCGGKLHTPTIICKKFLSNYFNITFKKYASFRFKENNTYNDNDNAGKVLNESFKETQQVNVC